MTLCIGQCDILYRLGLSVLTLSAYNIDVACFWAGIVPW